MMQMLGYIVKRTLGAIASLFIVITLIFLLLRMMPMEGYFGAEYDKLSEETRASLLAEKGLDKPISGAACGFLQKPIKRRSWKIVDL